MSSISGTQYEADLPADAGGNAAGQERSQQQENALLKRARNGDRSAYGQIVELLQDRLFNAMLRMVGDPEEARELTQEGFSAGWKNWMASAAIRRPILGCFASP